MNPCRFAQLTKDGMKRAAAAGKHIGRPRLKLPETQMRQARASGATLATIARKWSISETTAQRITASAKPAKPGQPPAHQ